jgi:hypothetical protein
MQQDAPLDSPAPAFARREAFIFVVDGILLEQQSWLLAASLARAHRGVGGLSFIAYLTSRSLDALSPITRQIYEAMGIETAAIVLPKHTWRGRQYPQGNKLLACAAPRDVARTTFLDTDMVALRRLDGLGAGLSDHDTVFAVPEGVPSWGDDGRWERAYRFIGQPVPQERVTLMRGRRVSHQPYFNAGFVSFPEQPREADGLRFGAAWLAMASWFDWKCPIAGKRPWLDQITLPLTLYHHGYRWKKLGEIYNYSLSDRPRISRRELKSHLLHYHSLRFAGGRAIFPQLIDDLCAVLPAAAHTDVCAIMAMTDPSPSDVAV